MKQLRQPLFWTVTAFLFLVVVGLAVLILPTIKPFGKTLSAADQSALLKLSQGKKLDQSLTILILGTDIVPSRKCNENNFCEPSNSLDGRSDTILLAHFQPTTGKVNVISIPRDSRVQVPEHGTGKINEANKIGGAVLAAQTVSQLLDNAPIDHYVRINPLGVIDLVDSIGGVRVYIKKAIRYRDDSQHLYIDLPQGWHTLSGFQTQLYMRFRYDELGDIGRVQRQQEVIRALAEKALQPQTLARLPEIFGVIKNNVDTTLSVADILSLARFGLVLDREKDLQMVMLPGRFSTPSEFNASYWLPDSDKIQVVTSRYLGWGEVETALTPQRARIIIQNATGEPLKRRAVRSYFREKGLAGVEFMGDYPTFVWRTQIIPQQGDLPLAEQVQELLGLGEVRKDSTGQINSDLTIRLGKDWFQQNNSAKQ